MTKSRLNGSALVLVFLLVTSGTAVFAQEETSTPAPPAAFTDGRISDIVGLGGLALYCVDENSNTNVSSFEGGSITVWGVGDQKYIELTADELRGNEEISQEPSVMEMEGELTEEAPMVATEEMMSEESSMMEATSIVTAQEPMLLARATTPNGEIGFFSLGNDQFVLQGYDDKATFFTYTWTGCSTGTLDHTSNPFLSFLAMPVMMETETADTDMTPEMEMTEAS